MDYTYTTIICLKILRISKRGRGRANPTTSKSMGLLCLLLIHDIHCTKIPFMYSFSGNCAASVPISTFIYSQDRSTYLPVAARSWEYINRSKNMNVEIGTVAGQFFSGNICFKFSVLFLCTVIPYPLFLSARKIDPLLTDLRLVPVGEDGEVRLQCTGLHHP